MRAGIDRFQGARIPLRAWSVQNFKSIREAELEFAPLTLLLGRNSSGKTSLIQSLLLVVQAVQSGNQGSAFPLNGPLVSVGDFGQARFAQATDGMIEFRAKLQLGPGFGAVHGGSAGRYSPVLVPSGEPQHTIDWALSLTVPQGNELGWAEISSTFLRSELSAGESDSPAVLLLKATREEVGETDADLRRQQLGALVSLTRSEPSLGFAGTLNVTGQSVSTDVRGLHLRAGVPYAAFASRPLRDASATVWADRLFRRTVRESAPAQKSSSVDQLIQVAASELREWNQLRRHEPLPLSTFLTRSGRLVAPRLSLLRNPDFVDAISHQLIADQEFDEEALVPVDRAGGGILSDSATEMLDFFGEHVVYLGPLRQDPQVVYNLAPVSASGFIGKKGEYLAAVLRASRGREVSSFRPDGSTELTTLERAVNTWAAYLDLADSVEAVDRPRFGIEVSVRRGNMRGLDLTSVGVGVSQLLPVIVMCLRSEPGSLILMEQPELHLHPGLQQKLGDFLLACARSGRQLVVETHSEYLVSRLRRRIAEDAAGQLSQAVTMYFVSQMEDASEFRRVPLNEFGGLDDWPTGFFDEASTDTRQILQAALEKRGRKA